MEVSKYVKEYQQVEQDEAEEDKHAEVSKYVKEYQQVEQDEAEEDKHVKVSKYVKECKQVEQLLIDRSFTRMRKIVGQCI